MTKIKDWEAMLPKDTIDFMLSLPNRRRSGRSTKMADHYVSQLFINDGCRSIDHTLDHSASRYLASIIRERLIKEHGCSVFMPGTEKELKDYNISTRKCFDYDGFYTFKALN